MDNTDASETPKRKRNETAFAGHITYFMICACLGIMVLFRADDLFGAVGLREYYFPGGLLVAVVLSGLWIWALVVWGALSPTTGVRLAVMAIVVVGVCVALPLVFAFVVIVLGGAASIPALLCPPVLPLVGFGAAVIVWAGYALGWLTVKPKVVRVVAFSLVPLVIISLLGIASAPIKAWPTLRGSLSLENHHYFLYLTNGWEGHPDRLQLYECNRFAISCSEVYGESVRTDRDTMVVLQLDERSDALTVVVSGEILYTYHPN